MEIEPIILTSLLFLIILIKTITKPYTNSKNLPPGPKKLPILGNLHQIITNSPPPHQKFRQMSQKHGPLMHLQLGQISTFVVSSAEFAKEILKTHDVAFSSRPYSQLASVMFYNASDIVFSPYGEYWRQLRKICVLELLSMKRVMSFRSVREKEVMGVVDWVEKRTGSVVNFTEMASLLTYRVTCMTAFGKIGDYYESFKGVIDEMVKFSSGFNLVDLFPSVGGVLGCLSGKKGQLLKLHKEVDRILEGVIGEHKKGGGVKEGRDEDLVDVLLKFHGSGEFDLSMDNIKAVVFDIFAGGTETSSATLTWTMFELMKNPQAMQKAQVEVKEVFDRIGKVDEIGIGEMKFLKLVIKETLRLHPPFLILVPRVSREEREIKGYKIPENSQVLINAYAIGRDKKSWSKSESFIPERFVDSEIDFKGNDFEFIPFGAGRRMCPGMSFGIANVELPLAILLYHFDWKLPNGMKPEDLDTTEMFGTYSKRRDDLCIIPMKKQG